jgi:hypothetical protein
MRLTTPNRRLTPAARAFRAAHTVIAAAFLLAIAYVWWCALSGRRGPLLRAAVVALTAEGALVGANRGDCPLGGLQARLDDPIPLFELILSPRAARRAVPVLGAVAGAGIALMVARGRAQPRSQRELSGAAPGSYFLACLATSTSSCWRSGARLPGIAASSVSTFWPR